MQKQIDIYDKNDQPTGKQAGIDYIMRRGLWHRGSHITIYTADGQVLIQKRNKRMLTQPGLLDVGSGGIVNEGEQPIDTAVRELREEVGITAKPGDCVFTGTYRSNHAFPRIRRFSRAYTYCYVLRVSDDHIGDIQREEVEWAKFVPLREAKRLVRRHRLKGLGMLIPHYKLYAQQLRYVERLLKSGD
jgi:8-oxo-dGTP pyrophosphatase MutT (NUDIX family)